MTNVHLSRADSVGIGAPETDNIEITPEMIEVGLHHLLVLQRVFLLARQVRLSASLSRFVQGRPQQQGIAPSGLAHLRPLRG